MSSIPRRIRRISRATLGAWFAIAAVLAVTIWALHPSLLFANTLDTGGDTGSHVATAWFLRADLLPHGQLTGWYPGWFDGFPVYTFYFVLSDLLAALASYVIPFTVAFKLTTVLGSLLLPVCAYGLGRLFRLRAPLPACLAAATLPFLFEPSFTIDGGNLYSTMAGEYAFSLSLALALLAIGLFARGMRTGRGVIISAVALSATLMAHLLPWLWAVAGIGVLTLLELLPRRLGIDDGPLLGQPQPRRTVISFVARASLLSLALSAWWLLPWIAGQPYALNLGYVNDKVYLPWLYPHADLVMLKVAIAALVVAWLKRSRFGIWLTTLTVLAGLAFRFDPQWSLWNERILPFWFLGAWLASGWLFGVAVVTAAQWWGRRTETRWIASVHLSRRTVASRPTRPPGPVAALSGAVAAALVAVLIVLPPMTSAIPASALKAIGISSGPNAVPNWTAYNFTGYQGVKGWTADEKDWVQYHAVVQMMARAGVTHGCGQSMWEYNTALETTFGTPEALMLLPFWTNNCIGSMEGLYFESSATTPYHFLNQSELSVAPSDAMAGLPYPPSGSPDVELGLEHLQLLGVRYFLAFSPAVVRQALRSPLVTQIATTGPFTYGGTTTTWHLFLVKDAPVVVGLSSLPNIVTSLTTGTAWQNANVRWWLTPSKWDVALAASGPPSWPKVASPARTRLVRVAPAAVTDVRQGISSISFHVSRTGVPVVVRTSYYPRWHVTGALGPYRVSPNLLAVVPTSTSVELDYGSTPAQTVGVLVTWVAVLGIVGMLGFRAWRRRRPGQSSRQIQHAE